MYLNIEQAERIANYELSKQEIVALEIIYHALEFYDSDSFEDLMQEPKVSEHPFFLSMIQMVFEYVESYISLGIILYKFGLATHIIAVIDEKIGMTTESREEFEYSQISFKVSKSFFQNALLIANKVKNYKLVSEVRGFLAGCHYFMGIILHQLGISLHQISKIEESKEAFQSSRANLESVQIFVELKAYQQAEEVKQAIHSLEISEKCCSTFIAIFLTQLA